jgi:uncharacterized protein YkwD
MAMTVRACLPRSLAWLAFLGCANAPSTVAVSPTQSAARHVMVEFEEPAPEERKLHALINAYRAEHALAPIPLSKSLSYVARRHVMDLETHQTKGECNMHSWSPDGPWSPCCYTPDHAHARCMWNKPRELTAYQDEGYENAYWNSAAVGARDALETWKQSPGHNAVILEQGTWTDARWKSLGVGISEHYAVVWFGESTDPSGYWR